MPIDSIEMLVHIYWIVVVIKIGIFRTHNSNLLIRVWFYDLDLTIHTAAVEATAQKFKLLHGSVSTKDLFFDYNIKFGSSDFMVDVP